MAKIELMCLLTALSVITRAAAISGLERPSAISASTSRSRWVSAVQRVRAPAHQELRDHLRVERGAARGHPAQRVEELGHVGDPVLEQVADAAGVRRQQVGGVPLLHVLRQHQDRDVRPPARGSPAPPGCPRRCASGASGRRRSPGRAAPARRRRAAPSPSPAVAATSNPALSSSLTRPASSSTESSPITTRSRSGPGSPVTCIHATAPDLASGITRHAAPCGPGAGGPGRRQQRAGTAMASAARDSSASRARGTRR